MRSNGSNKNVFPGSQGTKALKPKVMKVKTEAQTERAKRKRNRQVIRKQNLNVRSLAS